MSQTNRLLNRLKRGPITALEALTELGVGRCAARIMELREAGHDIHTEIVTIYNRYGEECRIGRYKLNS